MDRCSDAQAEFDEPETIEALRAALQSDGYEVIVLEASEDFPRKLEAAKPNIVFNIAEGVSGRGREAQIPAILDYYGVPYTGSDACALSVALDKALTKRVARGCGVDTPEFRVIPAGERTLPDGLPYPVIVKPNAEGSSKGISDASVAGNPGELAERCGGDCDLLAEQYVAGREFTLGMLGNGADLRVFEPMEIIFTKRRGMYDVYSYGVKKNFREYISYKCPPELPAELIARMKHDAAVIYGVLGCRDLCRADFRLSNEGELYFIEANPLPGLAPGYSDFPMLAAYSGVPYGELIRAILHCALKRYGLKA